MHHRLVARAGFARPACRMSCSGTTSSSPTLNRRRISVPWSAVTRIASRTRRFSIDGQVHLLSANEAPNHLHGGLQGIRQARMGSGNGRSEQGGGVSQEQRRRRRRLSGQLEVEVTYAIGDRNDVWMTCEAETDAPTHVNLTQHSYFNLSGNGDVLSHWLSMTPTPTCRWTRIAFRLVSSRRSPIRRLIFRSRSAIGARLGADARAAADRRRIRSRVRPEPRRRRFNPGGTRVRSVERPYARGRHDRARSAALLGPGGRAPRPVPGAAAFPRLAKPARVSVHIVASRAALPVGDAIHFQVKPCEYAFHTLKIASSGARSSPC